MSKKLTQGQGVKKKKLKLKFIKKFLNTASVLLWKNHSKLWHKSSISMLNNTVCVLDKCQKTQDRAKGVYFWIRINNQT